MNADPQEAQDGDGGRYGIIGKKLSLADLIWGLDIPGGFYIPKTAILVDWKAIGAIFFQNN
jgi:hypothetical protein